MYPPRREGTLPSLNREIKSPAAPPEGESWEIVSPERQNFKNGHNLFKESPAEGLTKQGQ